MRVLVIEDSVDDAELLELELRQRSEGLDFVRVDRLNDFVKKLESQNWDIVLSDFSLPDFNALDALRILKETGLDIPFIIVSGSVGEEIAAHAIRAGASDFFLKDRVNALYTAIQREVLEAQIRRERRDSDAHLARTEAQLREASEARDHLVLKASRELSSALSLVEGQLANSLQLIRNGRASGDTIPLDKLESEMTETVQQTERLSSMIENLILITGPVRRNDAPGDRS